MKQTEKSAAAQDKILRAATREFALHGYEAASMNVICQGGGISKGNLYHYFPSKEVLYLACVQESLRGLTAGIRRGLKEADALPDACFNARMRYFREHPDSGILFCRCQAVPDPVMRGKVLALRTELDELNREVIRKAFEGKKIRRDITREEAAGMFRMLEEMWNSENLSQPDDEEKMKKKETYCRKMITVFFYGVLEREDYR
jgi:TetR/AcrR family transcriptional regulator